MRLKALILDMDGLMIDSERLYFKAEREIAGRFDKKVEDRTLWKMMGRKPIESMRIFAEELELTASPDELLKMRDAIMKEQLARDLRPMPGLDRIMTGFQGKLKLAVATGAPGEFLDIVLDQLHARDRFAVLQTSDDIARGKPDPEIYEKTCRRLGLPAGECAVLEDSENGVIAAVKAGCYVIAVPSEYSRTHDFSSADFIARDLFHAAGHIRELVDCSV
jgi:HAD superfamily hydrolase (TIGR01509 family)